jgi:hypothetical protein
MDMRGSDRLDPLVIRTEVNYGHTTQSGYLTNLSEGGAFLAMDELVPIGHKLQLRITLPWNLGGVSAEAQVIWRTYEAGPRAHRLPSGLGLSFIELSDEGRERLRRYMQHFHQLVAQLEARPS